MKLFLIFVLSYLLGSIPTGYIVAKKLKGIDIREYGSGNTGATNVFRVLGSKAGLITAIGDVGKGILAILIAKSTVTEPIWGLKPETIYLICGILVIAGHNWSIFLGFNGGKGIATTAGVLLTLLPYLLLILVFVWLPIVYLTRYVSLGSIISGLMVPILMILFKEPGEYILFGIVIAIFVVYRHRSNIQRLLKGTENKIQLPGKKKSRRVR
ncbi:acyl-phosphate glycerol 3-phosphate acyltransferase [Anoxybacter fermentans]|uniref:Glycerol-3-phosphate acyltransferase n=1 Tax=Anoxybacter fermentans TaxID=1323375 RepID=A0A3S9SWP3_9FIRM|nr:glycerol-3-phosphate 1-O-acyltransferase PlsY [Anoxybacter fermentans]AZR72763.1 acyl-phosphate glycerol 3-phosphate acyltransferase [Anoxybacter fermentans]